MTPPFIQSQAEFLALCDRLAGADFIGFDTEFVSEDTYASQLCLIQVVTPSELALVDPLELDDVTPFWEVLAQPGHQTVVHAGREELLFSLQAVDRPPHDLFDIQLAAGLVGLEYPAGYGALVGRLLGKRVPKGETRTDWRKRPLSNQQLEYAANDVQYLLPLRDRLHQQLTERKRLSWVADEMNEWQQEVAAYRSRPRWRRTSGISGLSPKSLAIVRELWGWRETVAQRRDMPPRRLLRDDLIVEMAKRATADPKRILAIRGLDRGDLKRAMPELVACIERGLANPEPSSRDREQADLPPQLNLLGQYLSAAVTSLCRQAHVAPSLVSTASDVRDLVAHHLGMAPQNAPVPRLKEGWRAEVVGSVVEELLSGTRSIRIRNPLSEHPLSIEPTPDESLKTP